MSSSDMTKGPRNHATRPSYAVIGTSAGGVAALARILKDLPFDFTCASANRNRRGEYGLNVGRAHCLLSNGIVNEKVLPEPGLLSAQMRPPCAVTMPLAMNNPRPTPLRSADGA